MTIRLAPRLLWSSMFALATASVACGGSSSPAASPSTTSGTSSNALTGETTNQPTPEPKCRAGVPSPEAADRASCVAGCDKLDDTVPAGSRCISERASCSAQCNAKFSK